MLLLSDTTLSKLRPGTLPKQVRIMDVHISSLVVRHSILYSINIAFRSI